jgi:spore germination protein GerM
VRTGVRNGRAHRHHLLCWLGLVAVAGVTVAGCAIPTQSRPSTVSPTHVPFQLLNPHVPTTTTTTPPATSLVPVTIFLLQSNQSNFLTALSRVVTSPAPLTAVLTDLLAGPTTAEAASGITTAIPNNVAVLSASAPVGNVVTVNFNDAFGAITGANIELAVSQVVATVAAGQDNPYIGVLFEIAGQRVPVPIASGAQVPGPVYQLQFVPPSATTTTTAAP